MASSKVTIQDIADALSLSRNTVSKAINNTGILADATRERILQKAVEMGYKQFSYVSLVQNKSQDGTLQLTSNVFDPVNSDADTPAPQHGIIALLTTLLIGNSHFASTMLDKMQRELSQLGYSITMHRVLHEEVESLKIPNSLRLDQVDAIICIEMFDNAYSEMLCDLGLPTLFIDYPFSPTPGTLHSDRLIMDNRSEILAFVQEMNARGNRRIGYIGDHTHCTSFYERYSSFREALLLNGLEYDERFSILGNEHTDDQYPVENYEDYLLACLKAMPSLPDVFICSNDFAALDAVHALKRLGYSVPKDVLICGFDDSPESRVVTPTLTTIHIHSQIMGFSAVQLLISRINNPGMNYRTIHTETSLIYRESTGD